MAKPKLFVDRIIDAGFKELPCWEVASGRLRPLRNVPVQRGVYAFALCDRITYVGLASRSLKQRLYFYTRPGADQKTNIRLNSLICEAYATGERVRVFVAHPEDGHWNGFRTSGSEGLEAALIEDFDLPWNIKGSAPQAWTAASSSPPRKQRRQGVIPRAIRDFVAVNPRCTELQIAKGVFGLNAVQPQANGHCRRLVKQGLLERLPTRPATYIVKQ